MEIDAGLSLVAGAVHGQHLRDEALLGRVVGKGEQAGVDVTGLPVAREEAVVKDDAGFVELPVHRVDDQARTAPGDVVCRAECCDGRGLVLVAEVKACDAYVAGAEAVHGPVACDDLKLERPLLKWRLRGHFEGLAGLLGAGRILPGEQGDAPVALDGGDGQLFEAGRIPHSQDLVHLGGDRSGLAGKRRGRAGRVP